MAKIYWFVSLTVVEYNGHTVYLPFSNFIVPQHPYMQSAILFYQFCLSNAGTVSKQIVRLFDVLVGASF